MIRIVRGLVLCLVVAGCAGAPAVTSSSPPAPVTLPPTPPPTAPASASASPIPTTDPRPAPVGRIAFLRDASGNDLTDAFVVDANGENLVRLTNDAKVESALFWLTDGSRIVIAWEEPNDPYHQFLASMLPDGTDRRELGPVQTLYSAAPQSPDGRYIAFGSDGDASEGSGVRLLDLSTGALIELTRDGATSPVWSPDGSRLMVLLGRRLGVIDVASGEVVAVIGSDVDRLLGWTPDGRSVLFKVCTSPMTKEECLAAPELIAEAAGSQPTQYLDPLPTDVLGATSPDGNWVAEIVDGCGYEIVAEAAATRHPLDTWVDLVGACPSVHRTVSWSPDSNWVAIPSGAGIGESLITLWSPLGGTPVSITEGPSDGHPAWQPSPP